MKLYVFTTDSYGKVKTGTQIDVDDYTVQGDEKVWLNQERSFYDTIAGKWTIYDPIKINAPTTANVNTAFNVTATLPINSPDTKVEFNVIYNGQAGTPVSVNVVNGQAIQQFSFTTAGTYTITVSSTHHGSANTEVVVS